MCLQFKANLGVKDMSICIPDVPFLIAYLEYLQIVYFFVKNISEKKWFDF